MQPDPRPAALELADHVSQPSVLSRTRIPSSLTSTRSTSRRTRRACSAGNNSSQMRSKSAERPTNLLGESQPHGSSGRRSRAPGPTDGSARSRPGRPAPLARAGRPVVLAPLNGDHRVVAITTALLAGMLGRHRPAIRSEYQPAKQRQVLRRSRSRPRSGGLPVYGLSFIPEALFDNGLMLARVSFGLVDGHPAVSPVLQDLVKDHLVERPARPLANAVGVELPQAPW